MPRDWLTGGDGRRGRGPMAEQPDSNPMGDGNGEADNLLPGAGYRRKDRDSVFDGLRQQLDLVAVMTTVIIAGVVGYVGIQIMSDTAANSDMGDYSDVANNTEWQNSTLELQQGLDSFFSQIGTVFVVIVLVVVIGYLMLLRGR